MELLSPLATPLQGSALSGKPRPSSSSAVQLQNACIVLTTPSSPIQDECDGCQHEPRPLLWPGRGRRPVGSPLGLLACVFVRFSAWALPCLCSLLRVARLALPCLCSLLCAGSSAWAIPRLCSWLRTVPLLCLTYPSSALFFAWAKPHLCFCGTAP